MSWKSTAEQMCARLTGAGQRSLETTFPDIRRDSAAAASQAVTGAVLQELYHLLLDEFWQTEDGYGRPRQAQISNWQTEWIAAFCNDLGHAISTTATEQTPPPGAAGRPRDGGGGPR